MTEVAEDDAVLVDTMPCDINELRTLFLFEKLSDEQLLYLCENGKVQVFEPGFVYREGEPATCFYVLLDGTVALSQRVGPDDVETNRTSQVGVYSGAWGAYLGGRVSQTYSASFRAVTRSRFYVLSSDNFAKIVSDWFPMAVHLLEGLFFGNRLRERITGQRERLQALGKLAAGLTHELNNPASAAVRATASLRERVAGMRHKLALLAGGTYDREGLESLIRLQETAVDRVAKAPTLTPLETSDLEDEIGDWLEDHRISGGYQLASTFVAAGIDVEWLDQLTDTTDDSMLEPAIRWLNYTLETELLMNEIDDSTSRIFNLVTAGRQYSQMDRAPFQIVDIHELLDSTLVMLSGKLGNGVKVVKQYDRSLPNVPVYAAELNQVWTNLIDNAVQAMDRRGTLTITSRRVDDQAEVIVADTGPGVPEDIRGRIFEPFFTTKKPGEGTGLGLDLAWNIIVNRHHGSISVDSRPGDTRFIVRLLLKGPDNADTDATPDNADAVFQEEREA